jgi:histidinol phosphatase-like PHP family hydrolase
MEEGERLPATGLRILCDDRPQPLDARGRGLDAPAFKKQWEELEQLCQRLDNFVLLAGVELDILSDGTLDLPAAVIEHFDRNGLSSAFLPL